MRRSVRSQRAQRVVARSEVRKKKERIKNNLECCGGGTFYGFCDSVPCNFCFDDCFAGYTPECRAEAFSRLFKLAK